MEDVTDLPFRLICKRMGADLLYTEFASSEAIIRDAKKTLAKLRVVDAERPVAIQLFGGLETSMEGAARLAESFRPDFIDINCGCWVKNVAMRGSGAGLLRDLPKMEAIVRSVVQATNLPVTVKTRLGWDAESIVIVEVAKMLEQLGVAALSVHLRTRNQGHDGDIQLEWLETLKQAVQMPILGNGSVTTPEDARRMFETGCDGVMIGRGAIHNPWIFRQTRHYLATGELLPDATPEERIRLCLDHLRLSYQHKGDWYGIVEFRKHYSGYLKGLPGVSKVRQELMQYTELPPIEARLLRYLESVAGAATT